MGNTLRLGDMFKVKWNAGIIFVVTEILEDRYNCTCIKGWCDNKVCYLRKEKENSAIKIGNMFDKR